MKLALLIAVSLCSASVPSARAAEPASAAPATKPALKGMELYSWQDAKSQEWRYALLQGTNRAKTVDQIRDEKNVIKTTEELKKRLAELAPGETIHWNLGNGQKAAGWTIPPPETDKAILDFLKARKLTVVRDNC